MGSSTGGGSFKTWAMHKQDTVEPILLGAMNLEAVVVTTHRHRVISMLKEKYIQRPTVLLTCSVYDLGQVNFCSKEE